MKPGPKRPAPKNPKYHFEGQKTSEAGKTIYMVIVIKTGELLEWDEAIFKKNQALIEY
ncbi:MAG: hypothetical protein UX50_C0018G0009 [Candidatus Beckwithbacteria bacterium GW2011_GWA1_46_30]|nr:MAG: hypothetical protein UT99_C0026G0009 [Candidatus Curtissbacteria bacterium GW2011_GWA2_40_31]KKU34549.1 MAG: hypothetical protein UX50_C0018G0009 [Candidatus Beckwithbacteria bacterium GW2011_GWA1_46_30]